VNHFRLPSRLAATAALALLVALIALLAGACSRSASLVLPSAPNAFGRDVPVSCPNMIPNTPETAIPFAAVSGMCPQFRASRVRFEMTGDLSSPKINDMGACATSTAPTIQFAGGHANVFLHGTNTSVTIDGQPLTFGPLTVPPGENGVVLAIDARGNVLEIIWPTLAGVGPGDPIVRVQLLNWNFALVQPPNTFDITWDMAVVRDGTTMYIAGRADNLNLGGLATIQPGAPPQPPCIATVAATTDTVVTQFAGIVQFRPGRARFDVSGDLVSGAIEACGACAATDVPSVSFVGGVGNVVRTGSSQSQTSSGQPLVFGPLLFPGAALEPGVVLSTDAVGDLLAIIWPKLAGLGAGPPILRLELTSWASTLRTNQHMDVQLRFDAVGTDGSTATYTATGRDIIVPVMK
jgi:hypothetical protein